MVHSARSNLDIVVDEERLAQFNSLQGDVQGNRDHNLAMRTRLIELGKQCVARKQCVVRVGHGNVQAPGLRANAAAQVKGTMCYEAPATEARHQVMPRMHSVYNCSVQRAAALQW